MMSMIVVVVCLTSFDVVVADVVEVGTCVRVVGLVIVVKLVFPCLLKRNNEKNGIGLILVFWLF